MHIHTSPMSVGPYNVKVWKRSAIDCRMRWPQPPPSSPKRRSPGRCPPPPTGPSGLRCRDRRPRPCRRRPPGDPRRRDRRQVAQHPRVGVVGQADGIPHPGRPPRAGGPDQPFHCPHPSPPRDSDPTDHHPDRRGAGRRSSMSCGRAWRPGSSASTRRWPSPEPSGRRRSAPRPTPTLDSFPPNTSWCALRSASRRADGAAGEPPVPPGCHPRPRPGVGEYLNPDGAEPTEKTFGSAGILVPARPQRHDPRGRAPLPRGRRTTPGGVHLDDQPTPVREVPAR